MFPTKDSSNDPKKEFVFKCDDDHYHAVNVEDQMRFLLNKSSMSQYPGKLLPIIADDKHKFQLIKVPDNLCPFDWYDDLKGIDEVNWRDILRSVQAAVGWTSSYKKFVEFSKEALANGLPHIERLPKKKQEEIMKQFEKSKYNPSVFEFANPPLRYAMQWCSKLEKCDISHREMIERIIFKLPFDLRLHLIYKRPENKYVLAYLLYHFEGTDEDKKMRAEFSHFSPCAEEEELDALFNLYI